MDNVRRELRRALDVADTQYGYTVNVDSDDEHDN